MVTEGEENYDFVGCGMWRMIYGNWVQLAGDGLPWTGSVADLVVEAQVPNGP